MKKPRKNTTDIETLKIPGQQSSTVRSIFRQLISSGGIEFRFGGLTVKPKEDDLRRIHDIIDEVDDRRVFYIPLDTDVPKDIIRDVKEVKSAIHQRRKGLWADKNTRKIIQYMIHELGEFLTKAETLSLSLKDRDNSFPDFADLIVELRIKIWSAVARLYLMYGEPVEPYHLPDDILKEQKKQLT